MNRAKNDANHAVQLLSTQVIVAVSLASAAAAMVVLATAVFILIRCKPRRMRPTHMSETSTSVLDIRRTTHRRYTHTSGESFIQPIPSYFSQSSPLTTPTPQSMRHSPRIRQDGLSVTQPVMHPPVANQNVSVVQPLPKDEMRSSMIKVSVSPTNDVDDHSTASIYSTSTLLHHLPEFGSSNTHYFDRSLPATPVTPRAQPHFHLSLASSDKPYGKPDSLPTPTIKGSNNALFPLLSVTPHTSVSSALAAPRRWSVASIHNGERGDMPPSVFRRRPSQPDAFGAGRNAALVPLSAAPPSPVVPSTNLPNGANADIIPDIQPRSPLRPHPRQQRKRRTEPFCLPPPESYSSIQYARWRGPPDIGATQLHSLKKSESQSSMRFIHSIDGNNDRRASNANSLPIFQESPSVSRYIRGQRSPWSPTWASFRKSPGWV